ncbi:MAG: 16S rRNA (guanine(527)-N(7))-methyltransferase RsmG [Cocleimonas sp.]
MSHENLWQAGLEALDCQPSDEQLTKLKHYVEMLDRWNKTYNLTSVRDPKDMIPVHIFDSLIVAGHIKGDNCLDVGSGAGLPTIPLAIMQPERQFTSLDTNGKKTRFVQQAIIELGLKNAKVEQARIEKWSTPHKFDAIISRAFASVYDFVTASSQHLSKQGMLYAMKGQFPEGEIQNLPPNYTLIKTHKLNVPFVDGERHLIKMSFDADKE